MYWLPHFDNIFYYVSNLNMSILTYTCEIVKDSLKAVLGWHYEVGHLKKFKKESHCFLRLLKTSVGVPTYTNGLLMTCIGHFWVLFSINFCEVSTDDGIAEGRCSR